MLNHLLQKFFTVLVFLTLSFPSFAEETGPCCENWRLVGSIGGGVVWSSDLGASKDFPIINPLTDEFYNYHTDRGNQSTGLWELFVGTEWSMHPQWAMQMGVGYHQTDSFDDKGSFRQGADEQSADDYTYHYKVVARQLMAEGKLLYHFKEHYHPYLFLGLGAAFNSAYDYRTDVPPFLTFTREYDGHREASFTYSLGLGVDADISEHFRLGVGYRFVDLGRVELGHAKIDTTPVHGTLSQDHWYANEILMQLSYLL